MYIYSQWNITVFLPHIYNVFAYLFSLFFCIFRAIFHSSLNIIFDRPFAAHKKMGRKVYWSVTFSSLSHHNLHVCSHKYNFFFSGFVWTNTHRNYSFFFLLRCASTLVHSFSCEFMCVFVWVCDSRGKSLGFWDRLDLDPCYTILQSAFRLFSSSPFEWVFELWMWREQNWLFD